MTFLWVTVNVADCAPAAIVTEVGTLARVELELERVTTWPPVGAGPVRLTVPDTTVCDPPTAGFGESTTLSSVGAWIVNCEFSDVPANDAVMVAVIVLLTDFVGMTNDPDLVPPPIKAETGMRAFALLDVNPTEMPPLGAKPERVTDPAD